MSKRKIKQEAGVCPACGSKHVESDDDFRIEEDSLYYSMRCCTCECQYREMYTVTFFANVIVMRRD